MDNERETLLFIGGPCDGHRLTVAGTTVHVPTRSSLAGFDYVSYRRERIKTELRTLAVMVHEPLSMADALELLIANYKPSVKSIAFETPEERA